MTTQQAYITNEDAWLTQLMETGEAHVSAPLGKRFDVGQAVDEIRARAATLGLYHEDLEIGAPYVWRLTVRVSTAKHANYQGKPAPREDCPGFRQFVPGCCSLRCDECCSHHRVEVA